MLETSGYQIQCNQQCHSLGIQRALVSLQRSGPVTQQCDRNFLRWRLITLRLSYSDDASWPLCRAVCLSAPRTMWLLYEPDWSKKRGSRFSSGDTFYHKVFADTLSCCINAPAVISNTKCTIVKLLYYIEYFMEYTKL